MPSRHTKERLLEVMSKVNPDFNEDANRQSYSTEIHDDITTLLGNRDSLSDNDIQQIADAHNVSTDEVVQTLDYVLKKKTDSEPSLPNNSVEAEKVNDFFKFLDNDPQKQSNASVQYISKLDRNLAKPKSNSMFGRFIKLTRYGFGWEETYKDKVERDNPEWELQQRKGGYEKMEGGYGNVMERDRSGDEVLPIVPRNPRSIILVLGEDGSVSEIIKPKELQEKYGEYFQPSFFTPRDFSKGSGVDFRPLKLYAINRIAAGGEEWINPKLKSEFEKYRGYFKDIPNELNEISYENAKEGEQDYGKKIKEVLSEYDAETVKVVRYANAGLTDKIDVICSTKVDVILNVRDRTNPYDIHIRLNVYDDNQNLVISLQLYEDIQYSQVFYKDKWITAEKDTLMFLDKFIRQAAPYVGLDEGTINASVDYMIKELTL